MPPRGAGGPLPLSAPRAGQSDRRAATEEYLVGEIAGVYRAPGIDLDPRHIELIVRRMTG